MKFFSDQNLSYADILLPHEARARIEVSVLNLVPNSRCSGFLKIWGIKLKILVGTDQ
ncbi:hypothetical protein ARALYDRAFT_905561 [Arabidopsis lyrata subsp. lyrata]|uniref:Uncharacterized protein n=1 Tax=Arabidopsis lyrata subsp. lyrata TaxID=81972 RepID=D7LNS6_ARALL|nr:hypothetical protein ARALYDRAFT_905561 [Arabidopsis lyrata subsp. lyrata]